MNSFGIKVHIWHRINFLIEKQLSIEQNRCAMACQGCGAVLFLLK
jgi:hypothetical protein